MSDRGTVCGNCGTVNELGAQFCMNCGALLAAYVSALTPQPDVPAKPEEVPPEPTTAPAPGPPSEESPVDERVAAEQASAGERSATAHPISAEFPAGQPAEGRPAEPASPPEQDVRPLPNAESWTRTEQSQNNEWPAPPRAETTRRPWPTAPQPSPETNHIDRPRQEPVPSPPPQPEPVTSWPVQPPPPPPTWSTGAPAVPPPPNPRAYGTPPQTWIVLGSVLILISCVVGIAGTAVDLPFFFDAPAWCTFPIGVIILVIGLVQLATQRPRT